MGATTRVARDGAGLAGSPAVLLPGVGAFRDGMRALGDRDMIPALQAHAGAGRPLLGICLGMQLLASEGEEGGPGAGLGLVPGRVRRIVPPDPDTRVPNIGWCDVVPRDAEGPVPEGGCFYFAHSYEFVPDDVRVVTAEHEVGRPVVSAVRHASVSGVQFHPEKSQDDGLAVLDGFRREALAA